jgi:undecaprenyl-diphosphatase
MKKLRPKKSFFDRVWKCISSSREGWVITTEIFFGIFLCFFSLVLFLYFTDEMQEFDFINFDIYVSNLVYTWRTPQLTDVMIFITRLGDYFPFVVASLLSIIFLIKKHRKEALLFSLTLIMGILLNLGLKFFIQRPRPQLEPLVVELTSGFPSGHAMNSFIFFSLLSFFSFHFFRNKRLTTAISLVSFLCVILVGLSRIYLGVHYLSDIVAGYIAGFWWFVTVLLIDKTLIFYRLYKRSE